jgi:hypothetical protein
VLKSYVRLRRKNQTFFILCRQPSQDTVGFLKQEVAKALEGRQDEEQESSAIAVEASDVRIIQPTDGTVLDDDNATMEGLKIENEAILNVVFKIADNEWEPVDLVEMETE